MRTSQAALAIIEQSDAWLLQWNTNWQVYSLIGGHVEAAESFRECCIREITEELECIPIDIDIANDHSTELRFQEYSKAAQVVTEYQWQLFLSKVSDRVLNDLPEDCTWGTVRQIQHGFAADGRAIADQAKRVLDATLKKN